MSALFGLLICVFLIGFIGPVYGALDATCADDAGCNATNNEVCNTTATESVCVCNTSYTAGTSDNTTCFQDCGTPTASAGYVPEANPSPTTEGATATVSCAVGYTGTAAPITCEASGSWSAYDGCTLANCTTTISDANGAHSGVTTYGGSASIVCDTGYTGGGTIVCQADASWNETGAATCAIVDCGNPSPPTGYTSASGGATTYGSNKTVTCDAGSGYTGSPPVITCEASGNWTAFSNCSTIGGTVDCGSTISDGNGAHSGATTHGGTASIACNTGYTGGGSIICQDDGSWNETGAAPCTLVDCEDPRPEDGYVPQNPSTTTYQSTADVDCASGYNGTASQITCEANGEWSAYEGCSTGHRMIIDLSLVTVVVAVWLVLVAEAH